MHRLARWGCDEQRMGVARRNPWRGPGLHATPIRAGRSRTAADRRVRAADGLHDPRRPDVAAARGTPRRRHRMVGAGDPADPPGARRSARPGEPAAARAGAHRRRERPDRGLRRHRHVARERRCRGLRRRPGGAHRRRWARPVPAATPRSRRGARHAAARPGPLRDRRPAPAPPAARRDRPRRTDPQRPPADPDPGRRVLGRLPPRRGAGPDHLRRPGPDAAGHDRRGADGLPG